MRIHIGCSMTFDLPQATPMIALLNVHFSRAGDLERADHIVTSPAIRVDGYRDMFGNWCARFIAPPGRFTVGTDGIIRDDNEPEEPNYQLIQHDVQYLPSDTLSFLLPSRYCETDILSNEAWRLFGSTPPGWARVQAIVDFVHNHIVFNYQHSRPTRTAAEAYNERQGVCRDFAHLAIAFCRCMNIPARYCTGYISDINLPPPYATMDFAAWIEVYLGGSWHIFDPRNNAPRWGRILIAQGRDAADVPLTHMFGPGILSEFKVWTDEISGAGLDKVAV